MSVEKFTGEVVAVGDSRGFNDFQIYESYVLKRQDGSTLKLENSVSVPAEAASVFKPGLRGEFLTYSVTLGRRGIFALKPKGGTTVSYFKIPGEGMYLPMAIVCLITIVLSPLAIFLYLQHANTQKTKKEGEALYGAGF